MAGLQQGHQVRKKRIKFIVKASVEDHLRQIEKEAIEIVSKVIR